MMDITAIRIPLRATQWQCTTIQIAQFDYVLLDHIELSLSRLYDSCSASVSYTYQNVNFNFRPYILL